MTLHICWVCKQATVCKYVCLIEFIGWLCKCYFCSLFHCPWMTHHLNPQCNVNRLPWSIRFTSGRHQYTVNDAWNCRKRLWVFLCVGMWQRGRVCLREPESDKDNRGRKLIDNCRVTRLPFPPCPWWLPQPTLFFSPFVSTLSNSIISQSLRQPCRKMEGFM